MSSQKLPLGECVCQAGSAGVTSVKPARTGEGDFLPRFIAAARLREAEGARLRSGQSYDSDTAPLAPDVASVPAAVGGPCEQFRAVRKAAGGGAVGTPGSSLQTLGGETRTQSPAQVLPRHFNFSFSGYIYEIVFNGLAPKEPQETLRGLSCQRFLRMYIHWQYAGYTLRCPL